MEILQSLDPPLQHPHTPLTAQQAAFVEHYLRYRNATQAYRHAANNPDLSYKTANAGGWRTLRLASVQDAIREGAKEAFSDVAASVGWCLQRWLDIATADPRELIALKVGACRYCHGEGHAYHWREREFLDALRDAEWQAATLPLSARASVRFPDVAGGLDYDATAAPHPDCPHCHGEGLERVVPRDTDRLSDQALLLFGGVRVKHGGGYEVVIADRQKALENVCRIMGVYADSNARGGSPLAPLVAIDDLRKVDPIAAAKAYREMIAGSLAAS